MEASKKCIKEKKKQQYKSVFFFFHSFFINAPNFAASFYINAPGNFVSIAVIIIIIISLLFYFHFLARIVKSFGRLRETILFSHSAREGGFTRAK